MFVHVSILVVLCCWHGHVTGLPTNRLKFRINVGFTILDPSDRQKETMQEDLSILVKRYFRDVLPDTYIRIGDFRLIGNPNLNVSFGVITSWNLGTAPTAVAFQFMRFLAVNSFYLGQYRVDPWSVTAAGQQLSPPPETTQHPYIPGGAAGNSLGRETRILTLTISLENSGEHKLLEGSWELDTLVSSTLPMIIEKVTATYGPHFLTYRNPRILLDKTSLEVDMIFSTGFTEASSALETLAVNFVFGDPTPGTKLLNIVAVQVTETSLAEIPVAFKITNMDFKEELKERISRSYRELSSQITSKLVGVFTSTQASKFVWIEQYTFSKGSVEVGAMLLVNKKYMSSPEKTSHDFKALFKEGQLGNWEVEPDSVAAYVTEGERDSSSKYYIIGSVLGGIVILALGVGLLTRCLYWSRRDKKDEEEARLKRAERKKQRKRQRRRRRFLNGVKKVVEWQKTGTIPAVQTESEDVLQTVSGSVEKTVPLQTATNTQEAIIIVSSNRSLNQVADPRPIVHVPSNKSLNQPPGTPDRGGLHVVSSNTSINKASRPVQQGPVASPKKSRKKKKVPTATLR